MGTVEWKEELQKREEGQAEKGKKRRKNYERLNLRLDCGLCNNVKRRSGTRIPHSYCTYHKLRVRAVVG